MDLQSDGFAYVSVVNWMRARHLMLQGQMDYAMMYLDRVRLSRDLAISELCLGFGAISRLKHNLNSSPSCLYRLQSS